MGSSAPHPTPNLEDQVSIFISPGDWVTQLYPQASGTHFSRLLRHAWATVGLFFSLVTTRGTNLTSTSQYRHNLARHVRAVSHNSAERLKKWVPAACILFSNSLSFTITQDSTNGRCTVKLEAMNYAPVLLTPIGVVIAGASRQSTWSWL
jgi:hypothetical protein